MNKNLTATLPRKIIFSEAVVITLLFHLSLVFLFSYSPVTASAKNNRVQKFVLLNFANEHNREMDDLAKWLEYHDPSLIARPNSRYGYDVLCRKPATLRYLPDATWQENAATYTKTMKFSTLAPAPALKVNSFARMIDYQPVPLPIPQKNVKSAPGINQSFPVAVIDGDVLKNFFPNGTPAGIQDLITNANPSRIEVKFSDENLMPRISVESSSGNQRLDNAAIKEVIANAEQLKRRASGGEPVKVIFIWRKPEVSP
jgi:hypothetical protein